MNNEISSEGPPIFTVCRGQFRGVTTPVLLCHREPAQTSKEPPGHLLPNAGSLWHKRAGASYIMKLSTNESGEHGLSLLSPVLESLPAEVFDWNIMVTTLGETLVGVQAADTESLLSPQ